MSKRIFLEALHEGRWLIDASYISEMGLLEDADKFTDFYRDMDDRVKAQSGDVNLAYDVAQPPYLEGFAVIDVVGPLFHRKSFMTECLGLCSYEDLEDRLFKAAETDAQAIIMRFDSPGGEVSGLEDLSAAMDMVREKKKVIAHVGVRATSAGYWLACSCDAIIASPMAMVGSIGTVLSLSMRKRDNGVRHIEIVSKQSPYKRLNPDSEAGRKRLQLMVDAFADAFINHVASNRRVSRETVLSNFGQGDMLFATDAQERGMIDGVRSLPAYMSALKAQIEKGLTMEAAMSESVKGEAPLDLAILQSIADNLCVS